MRGTRARVAVLILTNHLKDHDKSRLKSQRGSLQDNDCECSTRCYSMLTLHVVCNVGRFELGTSWIVSSVFSTLGVSGVPICLGSLVKEVTKQAFPELATARCAERQIFKFLMVILPSYLSLCARKGFPCCGPAKLGWSGCARRVSRSVLRFQRFSTTIDKCSSNYRNVLTRSVNLRYGFDKWSTHIAKPRQVPQV